MSLPTSRTLLRLTGADMRPFLQGLISQNIDALSATTPIASTLLTPQGKILFDFFLYEVDGDILLDCASEASAALQKKLKLYKLRADVPIAPAESLILATAPTPIDGPHAWQDPRSPNMGWRAITSDTGENDETYHQRRIAACVPEWGADFQSDEIFLMDVNFDCLASVDYKKGCFVGQEVTSRMKRKGDARKRTLNVEFEGSPPALGAELVSDQTTIGECLSGIDGGGLALVRLDRWARVRDGGGAITCEGRDVLISLPSFLETQ